MTRRRSPGPDLHTRCCLCSISATKGRLLTGDCSSRVSDCCACCVHLGDEGAGLSTSLQLERKVCDYVLLRAKLGDRRTGSDIYGLNGLRC